MKRKTLAQTMLTLLLLQMLTLTLNIHPSLSQSKTWTVDDDGPADFHTIQEAVNVASSGDTLYVKRGTYYEHLFIDKRIKLQGENKHNTVIDGNSSGTLISVDSNNVTISGFTLRNAGKSWPAPQHVNQPDCAVWVYIYAFANISDNIVAGAAVGIFVAYGNNAVVCNNEVLECETGGIILYASTHCQVCNNRITSCKIVGIHLDHYANYCLVANNSVIDNSSGIGLDLEVDSAENLFENNLLANNYGGIILLEMGSNNVFRRNNMTGNTYNFGVWGYGLSSFIQDIDVSNVVNSKPIVYLVNNHDVLFTSTNDTIPGYLALINSSNISVDGLSFSNNFNGLLLAQATNCTLMNLNLSRNHEGMLLFNSSNNTILNNRFDENVAAATVYSSNQNLFYHNSFLNNTKQIVSQYLSGPGEPWGPEGFSTNKWDNGLEGNFWSDYNGTDSDKDGVGDTPYIIDANNQDNYPLMEPWTPPLQIIPQAIIIAMAATIIIAVAVIMALYLFKIRKH
jgi:parallel beta-helix repeat protein